MSYTPTTWTTGDTITATALNKIENGIASAGNKVARVIVDFRNGGISGSVSVYAGYAQYISSRYSIESTLTEYYSNAVAGRFYIPVLVTENSDDFKAYIFFNDYIDNMASYQVTGDISSTKVTANIRAGSSSWESGAYHGFEVSGDGQIVVSYSD